MSDKSASVRQYSTIGCLIFLLATAVVVIVWMSWRILHAPVPPKPVNDSLHQTDSIRKDSLRMDSLSKDSLIASNRKRFFYASEVEFSDSLFRFHLTFDSTKRSDGLYEYSLRRVDICRMSEEKPFQTISPVSSEYIDTYGKPIIIEDMNFDGYDDFRCVESSFVNGCSQYRIWLYDPVKKKFVENTELENTYDPQFDPKEKLIYSVLNETYSPIDETRKCFSWKNGKLQLEHSEECMSSPNNDSFATLTMTKRINGKLVTRSKDYHSWPIDSLGGVIYNWDEMK